jgi:hypothetical protein
MTNVKNYTTAQLLGKVKSLKNFKRIPNDYWILGVKSNEDEFNVFDDKFYFFKGGRFITVSSGTVNAGKSGLLNFDTYNSRGVLVLKTDHWFYDLWRPGLHRGRMKALVQATPLAFYRDNNKNRKIEEIGKLHLDMRGINFHTDTYENIYAKNYVQQSKDKRTFINGFSLGCQVLNDHNKYKQIILATINQKRISYCLINEF